jgi:hypothetical protein
VPTTFATWWPARLWLSHGSRAVNRDRLRQLTAGRYRGRGANGALFGFRYPWMVKRGEMRYLIEHARRRLGI